MMRTHPPALLTAHPHACSLAMQDRLLPVAQVGDLFVLHDTGAHSHSMGFQYNGKLRAPEVLIRTGGRLSLIRERENLHCLFDNTLIPADLRRQPGVPFAYDGSRRTSEQAASTVAARAYAPSGSTAGGADAATISAIGSRPCSMLTIGVAGAVFAMLAYAFARNGKVSTLS